MHTRYAALTVDEGIGLGHGLLLLMSSFMPGFCVRFNPHTFHDHSLPFADSNAFPKAVSSDQSNLLYCFEIPRWTLGLQIAAKRL